MYNFTKEEIIDVIEKSKSMREASKTLGVKFDTFKKYAKDFGLYDPNQSGKGIRKFRTYKNDYDVFQNGIEIPSGVLKNWLILERKWCCEKCGRSEWFNENLPMEIDHIDGNRKNNLRENLKILCPNCHSITPTWRGKGINTNTKKVSDEILIKSIKNNKSIRLALIEVGLSPKGGNYKRAYNLMSEII